MSARGSLRGLYLITPDDTDIERLTRRVEEVLLAGASVLQYRNKLAGPAERAAQASAILPLCRARGVPLIINDDWELASAIAADGVHLGRDDAPLDVVRDALGRDAIIGVSCYGDAPLAREAVNRGADYVAFGAFFASPTKPLACRANVGLLHETRDLRVPRVAIGGITPDNARSLVDAGADMVAVITGVFSAPDPAGAVRAYLSCFQGTRP
ncbi:MAG: thiamine phosphate synthase [Actinomycetota bacterium]|nr:thiamine phosphate synthase [Actinomycetota bacterium]